MNPVGDDRIWIFDTSSIIQVRRLHNIGPKWPTILKDLSPVVEDGRLLFPREVAQELAHFKPKKGQTDPIQEWAMKHDAKACRQSTDYQAVRAVLRDCPLLVDTNKTSGPEPADPWVLALALHLKAYPEDWGADITVVTEDRADKIDKLSLATACGLWSIPSVPLAACLGRLGIWTPPP